MNDEIIAEILLEIAKQLERLNKTMEAIKDGKINVNVSGGINAHTY